MPSQRPLLSALICLAIPLLCTGCGSSAALAPADASPTTTKTTSDKPASSETAARYDADGNLIRPERHHEWIFIGAPVTPHDMNEGKAAFPEFHNVYIDPESYQSWQKTGRFRDGTVILKELVSVGSKSMESGNGYFQGEFVSLEAMVKDTDRFSEEPGGWAFYRFGEAPNYARTGARMKTESCNDCHSGATDDYVFTDTYPVLRAARPASATAID